MTWSSTAAVVESIVDRINALTPSEVAGDDDVFRAVAMVNPQLISGHRAVLVWGMAGVRKSGGNRNCVEWQTSIDITQYYNDVPTESGFDTVAQRAVRDCEDILADLYIWAVTTPDIFSIDADPATPQDVGDGELQITRTIRVNFGRT